MRSSGEHKRPKVFYRTDKPHSYEIGKPAYIYPVGHPDMARVTGDGETPALTSPVQAINHLTGEFLTMNTHYIPKHS